MDRSEVIRTAGEVFTKVFGRPIELRDSLKADEVPGWDSFTHVRLIDAIERRFKIKISVSEIIRLDSVGALIDTVHSKVQGA